MNEYLTREIWKMRKNIVTTPGTPVVSLNEVKKGIFQLLFTSCGCNNACSFCNYGFDYHLTLEMVKPELQKIKLEDYNINVLQLESNGSFLSEREIPYDLFIETLKFVSHRDIPEIEIETHYTTITEKKLQVIREILGWEQEIYFELGFESSAEDVRAIYNKDIDIDEFLRTAKLCKKYNIGILVNVLLGAPFLTREEQIQDVLTEMGIIDQVTINTELLGKAVVDYFEDIDRLKSFEDIPRVNVDKIYSYGMYWIMRRHPIRICDMNLDERFWYINEKVCIAILIPKLFAEMGMSMQMENPRFKGFLDLLYYNLKYRLYTQQTLELMIEAFFCGYSVKIGEPTNG